MTADGSTRQYGPYGGLLKRIAELEDQLRLANIDAANATAECNYLSNQVDYLRLVLRKCQYDYENNSFAKSTRLAINNALLDKT